MTPPKIPPEASPEERENLEELCIKIKAANLGCIKFIGELYRQQVLRESIVLGCLTSLINKYQNEEDLEHFCLLMTTIGKLIDTPKAEQLIKIYFEKIDSLIMNKDIILRLRYALMEIVELRKRGWVPRRETSEPKPIKEVHPASKDKEKEKAKLSEKKQILMNKDTRAQIRTDSPRRPIKTIQITKKGSKSQISNEPGRVSPVHIPSRPEQIVRQSTSSTTVGSSNASLSQIDLKINSALNEYFNNYEVNDTTELLKEFITKEHTITLVEKILNAALDNIDTQRYDYCTQLLKAILINDLLTIKDIELGFNSILDIWDDIVMDSPKASCGLGFCIGKGIYLEYLLPSFLSSLIKRQSLVTSDEAEKILGHCLRTLKNSTSPDKIKQLWSNSQRNLTEFLKPQRSKEQFLLTYELNEIFSP